MVLDECTGYPLSFDRARQSTDLTLDWAEVPRRNSERSRGGSRQALFGIIQGSTYEPLRRRCTEALVEIGFDGYAIGGLSVGEPKSAMFEMVERIAPTGCRAETPRYLMGVGFPEDIVECVWPGRGHVRLRDAHAERPERHGLHLAGQARGQERGATPTTSRRSIPSATAIPAPTSPGPT